MVKALVIKELEGVMAIAVLALLAYLFIVAAGARLTLPFVPLMSGLVGAARYSIPFVSGVFERQFMFISGALAIALGLKQTVWEDLFGTWQFLLHRPLPRRTIILWKLLVGGSVYLICAAVPVLLFAAWAATPGTHASPFAWKMTIPVWRIWGMLLLIYLSAFLTGLRPARWYATRLAPLVGVCLPLFFVLEAPIRWIGPIVAVILFIAVLVSIFHVAQERDFA